MQVFTCRLLTVALEAIEKGSERNNLWSDFKNTPPTALFEERGISVCMQISARVFLSQNYQNLSFVEFV